MPDLTRESRPAADTTEPASISTAIKSDSSLDDNNDTRCTRCGAVLTAVRSVALQLGPVCRLVVSEVAA